MITKIMSGFPLRRCCWSYSPIVSSTLTTRMIRWLDSVCAGQVALRHESGDPESRATCSADIE